MSIHELKIYLDLSPESKSKILDKYAKKFDFGYFFFVDSEDGQCYLFDRYGNEKDISLIHEITEDMISKDIKKIVIPNNVVSIRNWAFYRCSDLTSVTISNSVTSIGGWAFENCINLTSVSISNSITSIKARAFANCNKLMNVTINSSIRNIGYRIFSHCNNLRLLIFKGKTIDQIRAMENYPFGIEDESIIKTEFS